MNKIFQIGFNRCGTLSLVDFFAGNAMERGSVVHWDYGRLATHMNNNLNNNKLLVSGLYEHKIYFSDMESCVGKIDKKWIYMYKYFKLLDEQYPESKFILNTRNVDNWIESRKKWLIWHDNKWQTYLEALCSVESMNEDELVEKWIKDWYEHHVDVLFYFKDRPNDLLVYDIEKDSSSKIMAFFDSDLKFKHSNMSHLNKSGEQNISKKKKPKYIDFL